jgi:molybdopterin converting factor small subunit
VSDKTKINCSGLTGKQVKVIMFGPVRDITKCSSLVMTGATVGDILNQLVIHFGSPLSRLLETCAVWVNGEKSNENVKLKTGDEVAILPPVSGG